ncbi:MAG TPA: lysylphosphatidylglycerol synthase domain-containing protein [Chloroflexota bacterium]|nr:lysylphosphatidylglycerol synthase domain-containing protein [Chloroflexota bacterium]
MSAREGLRRYLPLLFVAAILAAFYFAVGRFLDGARTLESLEQLERGWVAAAAGCALAMFLFKVARWRWYLGCIGQPLPWGAALVLYWAGQWFAVARGADLSRIVLAVRYGMPLGLVVAVGAAASLTDFAGVVLVGAAAAVGRWEFLAPLAVVGAGTALLVWALGGRGPLGRLVERELPARYAEAVRRGRALLRGWPLAVGLAFGAADALAATAVLWCSAQALGLEGITLPVAALVFALAQIAGVLSMMPLGLGVLDASGIVLLITLGVDPNRAAATLVVYRLVTLGLNMLLGGLGLLALRWLPRGAGAREPGQPVEV